MNNRRDSGFTVVELLISTLVFSLILVGAMAALVQMGRLYQKGVITARTQEVNRNVIAEFSQAIQFSKQVITKPSLAPGNVEIAVGAADEGYFCIGPRRYSYALDRQYVPSLTEAQSTNNTEKKKRHVLFVDEPTGGCANAASVTSLNLDLEDPCMTPSSGCRTDGGIDLLAEDMRITKLIIDQPGAPAMPDPDNPVKYTWELALSVAYGDSDLLVPDPNDATRYQCAGGSTAGSEFCAISELSTSVLRRL